MPGGLANLGETLSDKLDCAGCWEWLCAPAACCCLPEWLVGPEVAQYLQEKGKEYGPVLAGGVFGAGLWCWVDACVTSSVTVPWVQYLPGVVALLALLMITAINREELDEGYGYDDGEATRARVWLFCCYVMSLGAIVGSVVVLFTKYAGKAEVDSAWPGVAGVIEVTCVLASSLVLFTSRSPADSGGFGGYSNF